MIFLAGRSSHETIKTPFSADSSRDKYEVRGFFKISSGTELISCAMAMIASNSVEFKSLVTTIDGRSLICYKNFTNSFYQQASRKTFLSKIDIITLRFLLYVLVYCSDFWWIVLFIFITALLFLSQCQIYTG